MDLVYLPLNAFLISYLIYRLASRPPERFLKIMFWPALLLKLSCGILIGLLYQYQWLPGGDTFVFQQQAEVLNQYARENFSNYLHFILTGQYESVYLFDLMKFRGYSNSFFMVWLLHFLNFITHQQYYLNSVYFSLFSFWGAWHLTKTVTVLFPATKVAAVGAFLFFPSVVFWSSGVLKESILLGSCFLLLAAVLNLVYRPWQHRVSEVLILALAAYICFRTRYYFAVAYFPVLFAFAGTEKIIQIGRMQKPAQKWLVYLGTLAVLGFGASFLHEAINLNYFFDQLIINYQTLSLRSAGKASIELAHLEPTVSSVLYYAPKAIASAIFRPLPGEIQTLPYWLAGFENLLILILVAVALLTWRKSKSALPFTLTISLLLYVVLVAALIGLSTPNLGSLSRYRVAFLPFLLYLVLQTGAIAAYLRQGAAWLLTRGIFKRR